MTRFPVWVAAICFLAEPVYLICLGLENPFMPRLEERPVSFAVLMAATGAVPAGLLFRYAALPAAVYQAAMLALVGYVLFFIVLVAKNLQFNSAVSDLSVSLLAVTKGIAIAAILLRRQNLNQFIRITHQLSLILSSCYVYVLCCQIMERIPYPGLGGASYQKTGYILVLLIILNLLPYFHVRERIQNKNIVFVAFLTFILSAGVIYNGGRGALLALILLFIAIFSSILMKNLFSLGPMVIKRSTLKILSIAAIIAVLAIIFTPASAADLVSRGFNRIFEFLFTLIDGGQFDPSSLSYRDVIFQLALSGIIDSPLYGHGPLWASLLVVPPHNIFISFILQYGLPVGVLLAAGVVFLALAFWRHAPYKNVRYLFLPTAVYLTFSGNYLTDTNFWIFFTLAMAIQAQARESNA